MLTPTRTLLAGVVVFLVGLTFGAFDVDPVSAWIGTAGMALGAIGLVWLAVRTLTRRRAGT